MYLVRTPAFVKLMFPHVIWNIPTDEKIIYLTFDDGPIPEITPFVLDQLKLYDALATFFCVGDNIRKHPEIFHRIQEEGHTTGSHTYQHLNGWNTENIDYFHDVRKAAQLSHSNLFRPPYGKLKPKQAQFLHKHYHIIMWDVLSGDFDPELTKEQVVKNVLQNTVNGSVIVFHDSLKAAEKMMYALPRTLRYFSEAGYQFAALNEMMFSSRTNMASVSN